MEFFSNQDLAIMYPAGNHDEVKTFFEGPKSFKESGSSSGKGVKNLKKAVKFVIKKLVKHTLEEILLPGFNEALLASNALELLTVNIFIVFKHSAQPKHK